MAEPVMSPTVADFVTQRRVAHLATVTEAGQPHVVPISVALDGDRLVFATARDTQKVRNLRGDPHVAICFDEYTENWQALKQAIAYGRATLVESGPEFTRDRGLLYEKFEQYEGDAPIEPEESLIVEVVVDRIFVSGLQAG